MANKEPIKDGSPMIYTEKSEGVNPAYDIRTDRFELACEAMDKIHRSKLAKKEDKPATEKEAKTGEMKIDKKDGGAEPIHGTADESQSK